MKKLIFVTMFLLSAFASALVARQAVELQEGTIIRIRLLETLDSRISSPGSHVYMEVADNVEEGDQIIIERGARVMGTVTQAQKAKILGRKGKLDFTVDYVKATNGKNIRVRSVNSNTGKDRMGGVIAGAALINPLLIFIKGKNVTVEKGTEFAVYVDKDYQLEFE